MSDIRVTDLKQWAYCRRIPFYERFMPGAGRPTHKMQEAIRAQELIERLEMRRTLERYGLTDACRRFGVWLSDNELGLSGKVDLLLETDAEAAVVDFKLSSGEPGKNHRLQLAGYALLVQSALKLPVHYGFIYRIPDNRSFTIGMEDRSFESVKTAIAELRKQWEIEILPEPTEVVARCRECEYQNYCADVW